jgi:hypothetical protein
MQKRDKLILILNEKYPLLHCKPAEEFNPQMSNECIWASAEEATGNHDLPLFDYSSEDYEERVYVMGVNKELLEVLDNYNYFVEFYDPGTVMICPK